MKTFMQIALRLAKKANPFPNPRVGAVLVKDNEIIGAGYHKKPGMPHAEIEAIVSAKRKRPNAIKGATIYTTLEPCSHTNKRTPPCTKTIIANGIKRVVFAMTDPNSLVKGEDELREAGLEVIGPTNEKEAARMNNAYIKNMSKMSFVAIKMAMSADGKTATRKGDSKWITGEKARKYVYRLRSKFDAIMVGAGTVTRDDPRLTARIKSANDPYRIVVDGRLRIPLDSRVLRNYDGKTIVITTGNASKHKIKKINGTKALVLLCGRTEVDMQKLVLGLRAMGIEKILIEGGAELNAKAFEAGIVDKLYIFVAPKIIGGKDAPGIIGGKGIERMKDALMLEKMKVKKIGADMLLEVDVIKKKNGITQSLTF